MLQVSRIGVAKVDQDVAKVDRDVAHVAMAIHVCFKCMFQVFQIYVSSRCCKSRSVCCIYMHVAILCFYVFQVLHIYVTSVLSRCCICFTTATQMFSSIF